MSSITLDRTKPHGKIYPPHEGAHFEQGGYFFDHGGRAIRRSDGQPIDKPLPQAQPQPQTQSGAQQPPPPPPPQMATPDDEPDWGALVSAQFLKLKNAAIKAGYDGELKKAPIVAWLKETGRL